MREIRALVSDAITCLGIIYQLHLSPPLGENKFSLVYLWTRKDLSHNIPKDGWSLLCHKAKLLTALLTSVY
jgi:hypothetical protein